jgi:hypothetical protein
MSNEIVKTAPDSSLVDLGVKRNTLAKQIKLMIVNGKVLSDPEAMALAQYAVSNDLNPFSGEAYYIPGVGPTPGVAGWRKKAQEQLEFEAHEAGEKGAHFWIEEVPLDPQDGIKLNPGDQAAKVILRDWITNTRWRHAYFEAMRELKEMGDPSPAQSARAFVGPEPVWTGIGVIAASERFAGDGKPETMNRHERALKRAEKLAIRKRFPRISLPEISLSTEPEDYVEGLILEPDQERTPDELVKSLGYESAPADEAPQSAPLSNERPLEPEILRSYIGRKAGEYIGYKASDNQKKLLFMMLKELSGGIEDKRHVVQGYLVGEASFKDIPDNFVKSLLDWIGPEQDSGGAYFPSKFAVQEFEKAWQACLAEQGQLTMDLEAGEKEGE